MQCLWETLSTHFTKLLFLFCLYVFWCKDCLLNCFYTLYNKMDSFLCWFFHAKYVWNTYYTLDNGMVSLLCVCFDVKIVSLWLYDLGHETASHDPKICTNDEFFPRISKSRKVGIDICFIMMFFWIPVRKGVGKTVTGMRKILSKWYKSPLNHFDSVFLITVFSTHFPNRNSKNWHYETNIISKLATFENS